MPVQPDALAESSTAAPLGPDSELWRRGFPRTSLLLAGRALLLQVAHPTVGAGVRDFSTFRADPWGRLERTVNSLLTLLYGGEGATDEARRLQRVHRVITGTGFDGATYRADEPAAWAWVHLCNADTVLRFHQQFGHPLGPDDQERYWADWRQAGRTLGISADRLPSSVADLGAHIDEMAATTLRDNKTVRALLDALTLDDVAPPAPMLPAVVWDALRPLGRTLLRDGTVGTLPPSVRNRLGLPWTGDDQRRLDRTATVVRALGAGLPDRVLHYPVAYRAMRAAGRDGRRRPGAVRERGR